MKYNQFSPSQYFSKVNEKFNNKFDYSKATYTRMKDKLTIICPIHGEFKQAALDHLVSKYGCRKCGTEARAIQEQKDYATAFFNAVAVLHPEYSYAKVCYVTAVEKVEVICKEHGSFFVTPNNHISKQTKCPLCAIEEKKISLEEFISRSHEVHHSKYDYTNVSLDKMASKIEIVCPIHGMFVQEAAAHVKGHGCPICANSSSSLETIISQFLSQQNIPFQQRVRDVIAPKEVDFWIPEYQLAIECHGLYWHSDVKNKSKTSHKEKLNLARKKGIRLIQIFEDELKDKQDIVFDRLLSLMGKKLATIYGRKTVVREIDSFSKGEFLKKNHLQGNDKSKFCYGLYYLEELVAVMTFCKPRIALGQKNNTDDVWELSRFATKIGVQILGGASKLLTYFSKRIRPTQIYSYADLRWSQGNLYSKLGFQYLGDTSINYWYVKQSKRLHRFNFRKSELHKKLVTFDEALSERENMMLNGYNRLWDCGSSKWALYYSNTNDESDQNDQQEDCAEGACAI